MARINTAVKLLAVLSLTSFVVLLTLAVKNEVLSTQIKYILADVSTDHGELNLMLGSSSIKKLNSKKHMRCGTWLNRGIGNSTISDLSNYLKYSRLSIKPSKIMLYAGENDISNGMNITQTTNTYTDFIVSLKDNYPNSEIHIIAIKPSPARQDYWSAFSIVNEKMEALSSDLENVSYHPHPRGLKGFNDTSFATDRIHLTKEGYTVFTSGINETCKTK